MSRSNPQGTTSPCKKWFEWSGSTGQLYYYDKEKGEKVDIELPFTFLVLDQLSTITGYSDDQQSGIWSNEIRSTNTERLVVRTKNGILGSGVYNDVKNIKGARYTKSIYIAYYDEKKELQIGNFKAVGAGLSAWIEFSKGKNLFNDAVQIMGGIKAKKGATVYFTPSFSTREVSADTDEAAKKLDGELQAYLTEYLNETQGVYDPVEDRLTAPKAVANTIATQDAVYQDDDDETDDIPF